MKDNLFLSELVIKSQSVKSINYSSEFLTKTNFDFSDESELLNQLSYEVFYNEGDARDFIVVLALHIDNNNSENDGKFVLDLITEGHYSLSENVSDELIQSKQHILGTGMLMNFLRLTFFNFTSLTGSGGVFLPFVNSEVLHKKYFETSEKTKKKHKKNPKKNE